MRCTSVSLGPSANVFHMRSKPSEALQAKMRVINMPRLMSSSSDAFASLTPSVCVHPSDDSLNYCC